MYLRVDGMPTGFALLESSATLRNHWLRRLAAALIDATIIFVPIRVALVFVTVFNPDIVAGVAAGVAWFLYSGILEGIYGQTVGKRLLHLKVVSMVEHRTIRQGLVRSVPKMFWYIFLPIDVIIGLMLEGDPRRRFTDSVSLTSVISYVPEMQKIRKRSAPGLKRQDMIREERGATGTAEK